MVDKWGFPKLRVRTNAALSMARMRPAFFLTAKEQFQLPLPMSGSRKPRSRWSRNSNSRKSVSSSPPFRNSSSRSLCCCRNAPPESLLEFSCFLQTRLSGVISSVEGLWGLRVPFAPFLRSGGCSASGQNPATVLRLLACLDEGAGRPLPQKLFARM